MKRNVFQLMLGVAALVVVLGFQSEASAFGSHGSCGSHGGRSHGSCGSHGGLFHRHGSCGSCGGSSSCCEEKKDCGCEEKKEEKSCGCESSCNSGCGHRHRGCCNSGCNSGCGGGEASCGCGKEEKEDKDEKHEKEDAPKPPKEEKKSA